MCLLETLIPKTSFSHASEVFFPCRCDGLELSHSALAMTSRYGTWDQRSLATRDVHSTPTDSSLNTWCSSPEHLTRWRVPPRPPQPQEQMAAIMDKTKDQQEEVMAKKIPQPNDQAALGTAFPIVSQMSPNAKVVANVDASRGSHQKTQPTRLAVVQGTHGQQQICAAKKRVSSYIDGKGRPSQRPRPSTGMVSKVQICPNQKFQEREAEKAISTLKSR